MKVCDLPYERYTIEQFASVAEKEIECVKNAKSADEILRSRKRMNAAEIEFQTAESLSNCRYTLNTRDPFYAAEHNYYSEVSPKAANFSTEYGNLLLDTPFRADLERALNPLIFRSLEVQRKAMSPAIIPEMQEKTTS